MYYKRRHKKKHNPNWTQIPDHPCLILIIGDYGSGKTNALLNLKKYELDIDKICFYAKDPSEAKYQLLINKRDSTGLNYLYDSKVFIEYSVDMDDFWKNTENKKSK